MRTKQSVRKNVQQNKKRLERCNAMMNIFEGMAGYENLCPASTEIPKDTQIMTDKLINKYQHKELFLHQPRM